MTLAPPAARGRRARVLTGQVLVKFALFMVYAGMVSLLLPARVAEFEPGDKVAALATITAIALGLTAIAGPAFGALSDRTATRIGRRLPWIAGCAVVGGLAVGTVGGAASLPLLGLAWIVGQPALRGLEVTTDAYLVDVFPSERRGSAAGIVGLALVAGTGVGAVLSSAFVSREAIVTWVLGGVVIVAAALFAVLVRDPARERSAATRRRLGESVRGVAAALAAHPDYLRVLLWQVFFSIAYGVVFAFLLYVVTDLIGLPKVAAAHLIALSTILGAIGAAIAVAVGGWLSDRAGRRRLFMLVGNGLIVVGDLVLLFAPSVPGVITTAMLFGIGLGLSISCGRALASQVLPNPADGAAAGLGLLGTATSLGQAAAPVVGALVIGWGGYPATFLTSIVAAVACSIAIVLIRTVR